MTLFRTPPPLFRNKATRRNRLSFQQYDVNSRHCFVSFVYFVGSF